jgi:coiled-coil domain-containing protein 130
MIAKGVRFNAAKKAVGKYLSTTIWEFRMNCHLCGNKLVCRTDP